MRLIDGDALIKRLDYCMSQGLGGNIAYMFGHMVDETPTVDAVPVIRCKDCKFSSPNQVYGCRINSFSDDLDKRMYSDDFCSRAERRDE